MKPVIGIGSKVSVRLKDDLYVVGIVTEVGIQFTTVKLDQLLPCGTEFVSSVTTKIENMTVFNAKETNL